MKIFTTKLLASSLFIFILTVPSYAAENICETLENDIDKKLCELVALEKTLDSDDGLLTLLKDKKVANRASALVAYKNKDKGPEVLKVLDNAKKEFLENSPLLIAECPEPLADLFVFAPPGQPKIAISTRELPTGGYELVLKKGRKSVFELNKFIREKCESSSQTETCNRALSEVQGLIRLTALGLSATQDVRVHHINQVLTNIKKLENSWEKYVKEGRSQTLWELGINSVINHQKDDFEDLLQPPPSWQLIVLHPSVVYEYIEDSAFDGEQGEAAVALELLGFDVWDRGDWDKWYVPTGLSGTLNYADRAEVNDWGGGAMVHFEHAYSIGYAYHDGEDAVVVSMDLLKLFDSQKKKYQEYTSKWDELTKQ